MDELRERIEAIWADPDRLAAEADAVEAAIDALDRGQVRVAEPDAQGAWHVNEWAKQAILLYFRLKPMAAVEAGPFEYRDKVPTKRRYPDGVRVVPPAVARYGAYVTPGAVLMPSYVNIGARVGANTMVDTWATVGSCAQIGADVHLAGGVGIGGVLEPVQARPVIVEDGCFVGSRCVIVDGVHVGEEAVLGANTVLTGSIPIIDVRGSQPVTLHGEVPARAVVVPGVRNREFPAGTYGLPAALIIGERSESTDRKVSLNETLREHGLAA
ncbi:MAG TPA: 2,3,4,5-tetrahydropyridine-2,6-dicarboxylate N-succinyltransferase [Solirubrobacteraceae bacterium]